MDVPDPMPDLPMGLMQDRLVEEDYLEPLTSIRHRIPTSHRDRIE